MRRQRPLKAKYLDLRAQVCVRCRRRAQADLAFIYQKFLLGERLQEA
jgi:hypothetical protein